MKRQNKSSVVPHRSRARAARVAALALVLALGLGACGQKGPLSLPKAPAPAASGSAR